MFKCAFCGLATKLYEKQNKLIIGKRDREYWNIVCINYETKEKKYFQYNHKDLKIIKELEEQGYKILREYISKGNEIRKEVYVCTKCNLDFVKMEQPNG